MVKNYLLITLRSLMKNKLFILINISGLGIAIACCIVGYFNYDYNVTFDSTHLNAKTIYRINSNREFQNQITSFGVVPIALGNVVRQNVSDVAAVVRYLRGNSNFRLGDELFRTNVNYVDPAFFQVFTYEFLEGNGSLSDHSQICISDEMAKKYFGDAKALGKPFTEMLDSGKRREYVVAGVFKRQPRNSSFTADAFAHFDNAFSNSTDPAFNENSWYFRQTLFVQVNDATRVPAIESQIAPYAENNNRIREDFIIRSFALESFEGMGVRDGYSEKPGTWTNDGSPLAAVIGIGMMGILVLLIACFNLTNTALAISSRRLKEIGIRKVLGSTRKHLIFQFIGETTFICLCALVVGVLLAEYALLPAFNAMWANIKIISHYSDSPNFLVFIIGTLLFTSLLAGGYPSFYISKFQPTTILKGTQKFGGANFFMLFLLLMQFVISLSGIVCSIAFTDNAEFQKSVDLGFDQKGLVFTYVNNRSEYETYRNALLENSDIISIAPSQHHLYSSAINDPIKHDSREIEADILDVGDNYIKTVGLTLKAGRDFEKDSETDRKESVIVTEGLAKKLGIADPIGKEILWMDTVKYYIVGVVKDIYNRGLWEPMEPVMLRYGPKDKVSHILVTAPADKLLSVNKFMESKWKELFPNRLYNGRFMDEEMVEANTVNNNIVKMFVFLGIVALLLSATGLFTLVSLNIIKKMKEIGVRKVLGASVGNISRVINTEFAIILIIASVFGAAAGYFLSATLMQSIWRYYQLATPVALGTSVVIMFVVSVLSIGYKVYSTTKLNPALVLRDE